MLEQPVSDECEIIREGKIFMKPVKLDTAGTSSSGDALVTISPNESGVEVNISSKVANTFGRQIKKTVYDMLEKFDITNAKVVVEDKGAMDYAIRARMECAICRSLCNTEYGLWNSSKASVHRPKPNRFRLRRSMLFLSAQKISHLQDPTVYGADSLIIDLEDAVAVNEKDSARLAMYYAVTSNDYGHTEIVVRINGLDTPFWQEDVRACVAAGVDAVRIPKCETADDVHKVESAIDAAENEFGVECGRTLMMAALESPLAILNAYQIATSSERLFGITVSGGDLRRTLQTAASESGIELLYARQGVVYAARAAGVQCFDTVFINLEDEDGFSKEVTLIKEMGFDGKSLINPRQIKAVHTIFTPSQEEVKRAEKTVSALKEQAEVGVGVFTIDGKMLDIALLPGAQRVIELAKACGIYKGEF